MASRLSGRAEELLSALHGEEGHGRRHRDFELPERELWRAIEGQMRPGVAADAESLNWLMDSLIAVQQERVDLASSERELYAEFLTPVQQAQPPALPPAARPSMRWSSWPAS